MEQRVMNNLDAKNVLTDYGKGHLDFIVNVENCFHVKLPDAYIKFILAHNGASLVNDVFDYDDPNYKDGRNADALAFMKVEAIQLRIDTVKSGEEPDWPIEYRFEDGLIPFGDNGGGDMICFDYRHDKTTNNPPIVIWNHDMGFDHRVVFVANNFEEFINMLHEPED